MEELISVKGTNGTITAYEDRIIISRKGFMAIMAQGFKGDRTFYYKDISGIEYKKPGMINGYFKVVVPGTLSANAGVGMFGTSQQSLADDNTVVLRMFRNVPAESQKLYDIVMKKIAEIRDSENTSASTYSQADEISKFKSLLDNGAITQEEYDNKKRQLLNF